MNIFEQLSSGADVDMATPEYAEAIKEMGRSNQICFRINTSEPAMEKIRPLENELFNGELDATSYIMPPMPFCLANMHASSPTPTCSSTAESSQPFAQASTNWADSPTPEHLLDFIFHVHVIAALLW